MNGARYLMAPHASGQLVLTTEQGGVVHPVQLFHVVEGNPGGGGVIVNDKLAGQLGNQICTAGHKFIGLGVDLRLVVFDPEDLGRRRLGRQRRTAALENVLLAVQVLQIGDLLGCPAVNAIENRLAQRAQPPVHRQAAGADGAATHPFDLLGVHPGLLDQRPADGTKLPPPSVLCIVLGIAGTGDFHLVGDAVLSDDPGLLIHQGPLAAERANINTHKVFHETHLPESLFNSD